MKRSDQLHKLPQPKENSQLGYYTKLKVKMQREKLKLTQRAKFVPFEKFYKSTAKSSSAR